MAEKFKIYLRQTGESIHIILKGDFDGSSACRLSNLLTEKLKGIQKVVVHTDKLNHIYPFGRRILESNLSYQNRRFIEFEGKRSNLFKRQNNVQ